MGPLTVGSLFSGIGGIDLGLRWAGMRTVWMCETDPYCRAVLARHWPEVPIYGDIRTLGDVPAVDVICGGFPCQPFSHAGKQGGTGDDRHLWPDMLRRIAITRPRWVIAENVAGIIGMVLDDVCDDLEDEGYETGALVFPAAAVGAWHRRDRVWILAHLASAEREGAGDTRQTRSGFTDRDWWTAEPGMVRVVDGLPTRVDARQARLRALGNAVVPQCAEMIGRAITQVEAAYDLHDMDPHGGDGAPQEPEERQGQRDTRDGAAPVEDVRLVPYGGGALQGAEGAVRG